MYILKPSFYDNFKCIADECPYTCCRDWNILVDSNTYSKYIKNPYICEHCTTDNNQTTKINLREDGTCSFLNDNGLCELIVQYGEHILSDTCRYFPRLELVRPSSIEKSLSNACPAVLNFLNELSKPLYFIIEENDSDNSLAFSDREKYFQCRDFLIDLLQIRELPLRIRLYLIYIFSEHIDHNKDNIDSYIQWFGDNISKYYEQLLKIDDNTLLKLKYCFELFLSCNGKNINYYGYKKYIHDIKQYIDGSNLNDFTISWSEFIHNVYDNKSVFFENFNVNHIFKNAVNYNDDYSFHQNILIMLLEAIMIQFTMFLWWMYKGKNISEEEITEIACYYAKIMEHNNKFMTEFVISLKDKGYFDSGIMYILLG